MVAYQHIIRYQPDWDYPASDAAILASPVHARLCATVFYDPALTSDDSPVIVWTAGGGADKASGLPQSDFPLGQATGAGGQFNYIAQLYLLGWKVVSLGYPVDTLLGSAGEFPSSGTEVWYATAPELDAVWPGRGAFDPSQWKYDDTAKSLHLDASKLGRVSMEHSIVHLLQWAGINGATFGMSTDVGADWVLVGRSMGSHISQFVGLGHDRADPAATPGTRYAMPTRPLTIMSHLTVCTWGSFTANTTPGHPGYVKIPHWTDYNGVLLKSIGEGKAETGPNGEDQIKLASGLYHGFANADAAELNAVTPMMFHAADDHNPAEYPFLTITEWTYDGLEGKITATNGGHSLDGVIAMEAALKAAVPAGGGSNVHGSESIFIKGNADHTNAAQFRDFILGLFEEPPPPPSPFVFSLASTPKMSYLAVRLQPEVGDAETYVDRRAAGDDETVAPAYDIRIPEDAPGIVQDPLEIDLPEDIAGDLVLALADGEATPRVDVTVTEVVTDPDGGVLSTDVLYVGTVREAIQNPKGKAGRMRLRALDELSLTKDASLGIKCEQTCQHIFGKGHCRTEQTNLADLVQEGQVQGIDGRTVTITGLTPSTEYPTHYQRGKVVHNGVTIPVAKWSSATPTVFVLRRRPPASWLDATVDVYPGCDKTKPNCVAWSNEGQFLGIGDKMPTHHPNHQQPRA